MEAHNPNTLALHFPTYLGLASFQLLAISQCSPFRHAPCRNLPAEVVASQKQQPSHGHTAVGVPLFSLVVVALQQHPKGVRPDPLQKHAGRYPQPRHADVVVEGGNQGH